MKILSIILIAVSLSMDTFSLALSVGTSLTKRKDILFLFSLVGVFHFFMPLLGNVFGNEIKQIFNINPNLLLFYLFIFMITSAFFTYLGLKIGVYSFKKMGEISKIIGIIIILFLAFKNL